MTKESQLTFGVIGGLVIIFSVIVYILQGGATEKITATTSTDNTKEVTTTSTTTKTELSTTKPMESTKTYTYAIISTNKGVIEVELAKDKPLTTTNFGKLAESSFYDGVRFHRVIKGFMIQGGDPLSKDQANKSAWGTGGPGYRFDDELTGNEQYTTGTLAMANAGPNTNGSQFFIVTAQPGVALPPSYTVFGKVVKGLDVALAIENVATNSSDQPLEDVVIEKVEVR